MTPHSQESLLNTINQLKPAVDGARGKAYIYAPVIVYTDKQADLSKEKILDKLLKFLEYKFEELSPADKTKINFKNVSAKLKKVLKDSKKDPFEVVEEALTDDKFPVALRPALEKLTAEFRSENDKKAKLELLLLEASFSHIRRNDLCDSNGKPQNSWAESVMPIFSDTIGTIQPIEKEIRNGATVEAAINKVFSDYIEKFEGFGDNFKHLTNDIAGLKDSLLKELCNAQKFQDFLSIGFAGPKIILAERLTVTEINKLTAYIKDGGDVTAIILSKACKGDHIINYSPVPVVNAEYKSLIEDGVLELGTELIVDHINDRITLNPSQTTIEEFEKNRKSGFIRRKLLPLELHKPSLKNVRDGTIQIGLTANPPVPLKSNQQYPVKLVRSEGLLHEEGFCANLEENFYQYYAKILRENPGQQVTLRAPDLNHGKIGKEFLAYLSSFRDKYESVDILNGSRLLLKYDQEILRPWVRACLRAGAGLDNAEMLFPKVLSDVMMVKINRIIDEEKSKLEAKRIPITSSIRIGAMIETPSAKDDLHKILKNCDFISVGSTDFSYSTLNAPRDRGVNITYEDSAIVNGLNGIMEIVQKHNRGHPDQIHTPTVCGAYPNDPRLLWILAGLGYTSFAVDAENAARANYVLACCDPEECKQAANHIINHSFESLEAIKSYVNGFYGSLTLSEADQRAFGTL